MSDDSEFLTIKEVAERTGYTRIELRILCRGGRFFNSSYKQNGQWLIPASEVERLKPERKWWNYIRYRLPVFVTIITLVWGVATVGISTLADWGGADNQVSTWVQQWTFKEAEEGETLILIFPFYYSNGVTTTEPHRILERELKAMIASEGLTDFRVAIYPQTLNQDDRAEAEKIGQQEGATVVLYGEELPQETVVNILGIAQETLDQVSSGTERSLLASPAEYARFVTEDLPQETATLSFFTIGTSFYFEDVMQQAIESYSQVIKLVIYP